MELFKTVSENILICNISRTKSSIFFDSDNFRNVPCDISKLDQIDAAISQVLELRKEKGFEKDGILVINNARGYVPYGHNTNFNINLIVNSDTWSIE